MCGGNLDVHLEKAWNTIKYVVIALKKGSRGCLESFTTDRLLISIATILDGESYGENNIKVATKAASKVKDHLLQR